MLKELDLEGTQLRKAHRLKKRSYANRGPNENFAVLGQFCAKIIALRL